MAVRVFVVALLACSTVLGCALIGAHTYKTRTRVNDVVMALPGIVWVIPTWA